MSRQRGNPVKDVGGQEELPMRLAKEFAGQEEVVQQSQELSSGQEGQTGQAGQVSGAGGMELCIKAYNQQTQQARQDKLIVENIALVHKIVSKVINYLRPPMSREDLVSAGTIGLVKAARDYDSTKDAEFGTYAYIRIKGAVIDELRGWSFTPTGLKKQFREAKAAARQLAIDNNGAVPSDEQLAKHLGLSIRQLDRLFENARARHFLSIHGLSDESPSLAESLAAPDGSEADDAVEKKELAGRLAEAIGMLPEKQRRIIAMYYTKELTMKQIAEVMNITESRVSQLHAGAIFRLSATLGDWKDEK